MASSAAQEILDGVWRFSSVHPDWTPEEGGEDGWEPEVTWWALRTPQGLVLIDPLVDDWDALDALVAAHGPCAGIVRMLHWHERSVAETAARHGVSVWAGASAGDAVTLTRDHTLHDGDEPWDGVQAFTLGRDDELALWFARPAALVFADAMLRGADGTLRVCPESWTMPAGGVEALRGTLRDLGRLPMRHVLVSHGPSVTGDDRDAFDAALR